jgi:hypothetical protein
MRNLFLSGIFFFQANLSSAQTPSVDFFVLENNVPNYSTFAGFQNHVVHNSRGTFVSYLAAAVDGNKLSTGVYLWRLAQIDQQTFSFRSIYSDYAFTRAPVIETDRDENIYVIFPLFNSGQVQFRRFNAADNYTASNMVVNLPIPSEGKYASYYDRIRNQIYFMTMSYYYDSLGNLKSNSHFYAIDVWGNIIFKTQFTHAGANAFFEYPQLTMNGNTLYAAWTTDSGKGGGPSNPTRNYHSIAYAKSEDGGRSWKNDSNIPLTLPFSPDELGPATQVLGASRIGTNRWLTNFTFFGGLLHFADMFENASGLVYSRLPNITLGQSIKLGGWGGFVTSTDKLFYVGGATMTGDSSRNANTGLGILQTTDTGASWSDYAFKYSPGLNQSANNSIWAVDTARTVTTDGYIVGIFTSGDQTSPSSNYQTIFYRVKVQNNSGPILQIYPRGLFRIDGGIFYSDGVSQYCGYPNWELIYQRWGLVTLESIPNYKNTPANQGYAGACQ